MDRPPVTEALVRARTFAVTLLVTGLASYALASATHARSSTDSENRGGGAGPLRIAQLTPIGQAENAVGTLIVRRADGRVDQLRGKGSLPLHEGDECKTERASQAFIRLADGTQLAMNEDTTFIVRARRERERGLTRIFKLLLGEMWIKTPGPKALKVETPVATAAIKGTEFNLRVLPDGKSILTVVEGLVEFGTPFGTCPIPGASQSLGERGKRCTRPAPVNPAEVISWIKNVVR